MSQGGTYSQFDEDRVLIDLIGKLPDIPRQFVEIGAGDGSENCTRILLDYGWRGVWVDPLLADVGTPPGVTAVARKFTLAEALESDVSKTGVLSIDIDGNDYHLWEAFGPGPAIVIIEAQIQRPEDLAWVMPYDPAYEWDHKSHDCGASVFSMIELGKRMGYSLVARPSNPHSPNLFFCKDELVSKL